MDLYHYSGSIQFNGFASESGSYYLMARNDHASRKSDPFTVTVTSPSGIPPVVRYNPYDATVNPGERVFLSLMADGSPDLTYLWYKDSVLVGTNAPYLEIPSAKATDAGKYGCVILNNHGGASSMITTVEVRPEGGEIGEAEDSTAHLMNLSARARVGEGGDLLIGGLVVIEGPVRVLVRAAGPSLANMGITNPLKDPTITAFKGETPIGTNDNWGDGDPSLAQIFSKVGASPYDSPTSKDAALLLTLNPGGYTFHVTGADGGTGVALLEIYLVPDPDLTGMIVNLSARAKVGAGENLLIGGVVVEGDAQGSILVRGVGPSLVTSGVTNPLTDPRLALFKADQQIGNADNWGTDYLPREMGSLFRRLGASELPSNSADAVKYLQVPSGGYTFQVTGKDGGEGVALIETYLVRPDWD